MLEGDRIDVSYVGPCFLDCIWFAGEFQPLVCEPSMVFCTSSRLSNSPRATSLSILPVFSVSARILSFYSHASLLAVFHGLSLFFILGPARCRCLLRIVFIGSWNDFMDSLLNTVWTAYQAPGNANSSIGQIHAKKLSGSIGDI
jgi:hypothetical protein